MSTQGVVDARYTDVALVEHRGNPLIEALPGHLFGTEVLKRLKKDCAFDPAERQASPADRLNMVQRLKNLVIPMPGYLEVYSSLSTMVRKCYVARNPLDPKGQQLLYKSATMQVGQYDMDDCEGEEDRAPEDSQMAIVGISGMGKSTLIRSCLRLLGPQVIRHNRGDFQALQITRIKINTPHNASLRELGLDFLKAVDRLTGETDYGTQYEGARVPLPAIKAAMRQVAMTYFLGVLVIDEIQHLSARKTQGYRAMLNFFMNLMNELKIPIVLIGTPAAEELFAERLQDSRRAADNGFHSYWHPASWDDPDWIRVVKAVWQYQWLRVPEPLTDDMQRLIYDLTGGVTAILRVLMIKSQEYCLLKGEERLTAATLKAVHKTKLRVLHKAIKLLKKPMDQLKSSQLRTIDDLFGQVEVRDLLDHETPQ